MTKGCQTKCPWCIRIQITFGQLHGHPNMHLSTTFAMVNQHTIVG